MTNQASTTTDTASLSAYDQSEHSSCDICGKTDRLTTIYAFPGDNTVQIRYFAIPSEYDRLCSSCFETANNHDALDLSEDELIAGIISDSYGYATPAHAARHIEDYRNDEQHCHCERGHAHFDNDLEQLIEAARRRWISRSPEEKQALLETVAGWRDVEQDDAVAALGISMSYPSHAPELAVQEETEETNCTIDDFSNQELQSSLFLRTDTYKFFTVDTLPDDTDQIAFEYLNDTFPTRLSTEKAHSVFENSVVRIDLSDYDTRSPSYEDTFLTPTDHDIAALHTTLQRAQHPPETYLDHLITLKHDAGHFDTYTNN